MRSHTYLVGLVGGLLLVVTLYYPLYLYVPSAVVEGWESAQPGLAQIFFGVALLLVIATGAVAAVMSGTKSRLQAAIAGAVAGLIAAAIAEIWLGAPAAGVWGARGGLTYGFRPASSDYQFADLLSNGILSIILWSYASEWAAILVGVALGALGGFLAGPGGAPDRPTSDTWPLELSVIGMLTWALGIIVTVAGFSLLGPLAQKFADENGVVLAYPSSMILNWAACTNFAIFLVWQALGAWWLKTAKPVTVAGHYRLLLITYLNGFLPIALAVFLFIVSRDAFANPVTLIGILLTLALAALTLRIGWPLRLQPKPIVSSAPTPARFYLKEAMLGAAVMFSATYFSTPIAALNLVMLVVTGIGFWTPTSASPNHSTLTVAQAVRDNYAAHQQYILVGGVVLFAISLLIAGGIYFFMRWRAAKSVAPTGPTL